MSSKSRRRIRPHEQARSDQVMAAARNHGASDPAAGVSGVEYADPGTPCCWCDCPLEAHLDPAYNCPCCDTGAVFLFHDRMGTLHQCTYPLCERHFQDFVQLWVSRCPTANHEFRVYGAYDEDILQ